MLYQVLENKSHDIDQMLGRKNNSFIKFHDVEDILISEYI